MQRQESPPSLIQISGPSHRRDGGNGREAKWLLRMDKIHRIETMGNWKPFFVGIYRWGILRIQGSLPVGRHGIKPRGGEGRVPKAESRQGSLHKASEVSILAPSYVDANSGLNHLTSFFSFLGNPQLLHPISSWSHRPAEGR